MTNVLSSSANAALSHDRMSSNVTEWLLQEICFYSVTIKAKKWLFFTGRKMRQGNN